MTGGAQEEHTVRLAGMRVSLGSQCVVMCLAQLAPCACVRGGKRPASERPGRPQHGGPPQQYAAAPAGPRGPALNLRNPVFATERELLKLALQRPELVSPAFDAYGVDEFTAPPYAAVRQAIMDAGGAQYGTQEPPEDLI